jgi:CRP/FNR family transcriptional regulator
MLDLIRDHFSSFYEPELLQEIADVGEIVEMDAGDVIMDIGSYIKSMPLLLVGAIKVLREDEEGNELLVYYLHAGGTCAVSLTCCMRQETSSIRAICEEDVQFISIPVKYMDVWMKKYDSWKNFVLETYRQRFEELLETIDSIAFLKMDERLLKFLNGKREVTKSSVFNITHQEIAYDLHSSREVISRLLKKLEKLGKIKLGRNKIELLDI